MSALGWPAQKPAERFQTPLWCLSLRAWLRSWRDTPPVLPCHLLEKLQAIRDVFT